MELHGKRVAMVEDQYEDLELWYPALRLREAGDRVTVVGTLIVALVETSGATVSLSLYTLER
jgi:putative intracellular protease/amidase